MGCGVYERKVNLLWLYFRPASVRALNATMLAVIGAGPNGLGFFGNVPLAGDEKLE